MAIVITKDKEPLKVTGADDALESKDKLETIKIKLRLLLATLPNYVQHREEIDSYDVELPHIVDLVDLSKMNKLYAITQSFFSRVTTLAAVAIGTQSEWKRLENLVKSYIEDKESKLFMTQEILDLPNSRTQQAAVRSKLTKLYDRLADIQDYLAEADAFKRIVEAKKKDLNLVMTNLNRQIKTVSIEQNLTR